ncbi:hypothetical protein [Tahibacter harae]|uniref:DUF2207 domain-containing protein n=1 Tax=Tahibacter harae TaxID=2963937 RepID=A0ABT1QXZ7_9GAMM|nr:hypothetical protein [Tahibacter harae]MCQ4167157.1 hypothetical protein [Tahibacter harae]
MTRRLVLLLVAGWLLLLGLFAGIAPLAPLWPAQREKMEGSSFAAMRGGQIDGAELAVTEPDQDYGALLIRPVDLDADQWPLLRYSFADLPPTLELTLVYRRADSPSDVRTIALAQPRGGSGSIDLRREKEWRGRINELGFAIYPVAQSVPPQQGFRPFRFLGAELATPSWQGRLSAVATEWSARRAWSLMSISALGPDAGPPREASPVLLLALGLGFTVLLLAWGLPGAPQQALRVSAVVLIVAWLLLDLRWSRSLAERHAATRQIYAGLDWQERQDRLPDAELLAAARTVRETLRAADLDPDKVRILVDAGSDFLRARLVYHLAPAATGPTNLTGYGVFNYKGAPRIVVAYETESPQFDTARQRLVFDEESSTPAEELLAAPPLRIYRVIETAAP